MSQFVYFYNESDPKKDNDDDHDISERPVSVLRKKSEKEAGVLVTALSVLGLKRIWLWKGETDLATWL